MLDSILRILALTRKELLSVLKDPRTRMSLLVPPLMQALIFVMQPPTISIMSPMRCWIRIVVRPHTSCWLGSMARASLSASPICTVSVIWQLISTTGARCWLYKSSRIPSGTCFLETSADVAGYRRRTQLKHLLVPAMI